MPILSIRFGISIVFGCSTEYFKLVHNLFGKLHAKTVQTFLEIEMEWTKNNGTFAKCVTINKQYEYLKKDNKKYSEKIKQNLHIYIQTPTRLYFHTIRTKILPI